MLRELGWDDERAAELPEGMLPARVVAVHRGRIHVMGSELDDLLPLAGAADDQPVVGDWVGVRDGAVRTILPRRTELAREEGALVANVDVALVASSLNQDLNLRRLERFVALARAGGIRPIALLTKGDLSSDPAAEAEDLRERLQTDVIAISAQDGWGLPALRAALPPGTTAVLVGMSGVGKSTLVNVLLGEERQRTLTVREHDGRGRHATTHRELFVLDWGALLIDTPGVRRPGLASAENLDEAFTDITELAQQCRFADCAHEEEPGCAVRDAVDPDRLAHWRRLQREGWDAQQRKAWQRAGTREYRRIKRS